MPKARTLSLSDHHVASVAPAEGLLYNPAWRMLEDGDLDALALRLTQGRTGPIPIFAYGSLIWNPGFAVQDRLDQAKFRRWTQGLLVVTGLNLMRRAVGM